MSSMLYYKLFNCIYFNYCIVESMIHKLIKYNFDCINYYKIYYNTKNLYNIKYDV